jgi:hypothetical protein
MIRRVLITAAAFASASAAHAGLYAAPAGVGVYVTG